MPAMAHHHTRLTKALPYKTLLNLWPWNRHIRVFCTTLYDTLATFTVEQFQKFENALNVQR